MVLQQEIQDIVGLLNHKDLVTLELNGTKGRIPIFGEHIDYISSKYYEHLLRIFRESKHPNKGFSDSLYYIFYNIEQQARLGDIASDFHGDGTIYDIGCGIGLASIVYAKLTGRPIIAFDRDRADVERAKELSKLFGVDDLVELSVDNAEHFFETKSLSKKDTFLISGISDRVSNHLMQFLLCYSVSLIHNSCYETKYLNDGHFARLCLWFADNRYNLRAFRARLPSNIVLIAKK